MRLGHKLTNTIELIASSNCASYTQIVNDRVYTSFFGGDSEEVTPVPIPNTEVKLFSADGTARVTVWESRTSPKNLLKARIHSSQYGSGLFLPADFFKGKKIN